MDSEILVITNLNCLDFYHHDILKVRTNDRIYFSEINGWFIYLSDKNLVNIEYTFFNQIS